jgi:hypothetical protein
MSIINITIKIFTHFSCLLTSIYPTPTLATPHNIRNLYSSYKVRKHDSKTCKLISAATRTNTSNFQRQCKTQFHQPTNRTVNNKQEFFESIQRASWPALLSAYRYVQIFCSGFCSQKPSHPGQEYDNNKRNVKSVCCPF